jgi:hypothetical protein
MNGRRIKWAAVLQVVIAARIVDGFRPGEVAYQVFVQFSGNSDPGERPFPFLNLPAYWTVAAD